MSNETAAREQRADAGQRLVYWLALLLVVVGLLNAMPGIPGIDDAFAGLFDSKQFVIRKYPYEYFYPIAFSLMMIIVALKHSLWRDLVDRSALRRRLGLAMDIALVIAAIAISMTYMVEIEAVCLVDQITGERAELIARSLAEEIEFAETYGLPVPDTVADPQCINTTQGWLVAILGLSILVFLAYNVKVWGLPLVLVAITQVSSTSASIAARTSVFRLFSSKTASTTRSTGRRSR